MGADNDAFDEFIAAVDNRLEKLEAALRQIREHHVQLNQRAGRDLRESRTIALCDQALGE